MVILLSHPNCSQRPLGPSKGFSGEVNPSRANNAANTPDFTADAVAQPFHIDNSPTLVAPIGKLGTTDKERACNICSLDSFRSLQAIPAALRPKNTP